MYCEKKKSGLYILRVAALVQMYTAFRFSCSASRRLYGPHWYDVVRLPRTCLRVTKPPKRSTWNPSVIAQIGHIGLASGADMEMLVKSAPGVPATKVSIWCAVEEDENYERVSRAITPAIC